MGGGAWPFLLRGVICLVNSDNERDLNLLNRQTDILVGLVSSDTADFLERLLEAITGLSPRIYAIFQNGGLRIFYFRTIMVWEVDFRTFIVKRSSNVN